MEILLLVMILCIVWELKDSKEIQKSNPCSYKEIDFQSKCDDEKEKQEREQYYREYESRGRQKYYEIPCPWIDNEEK